MANIDDKRDEVIARMRDVGKKISRMKSANDVSIAGTNLDPRVPRGRVNRLNNRQLDSLMNRLNSFQSRQVQFVPDAHGRAMPKSKFSEYISSVKAYNRRVNKRQSRYDDVFLKSSGQTVAERRAMVTPRHRQASNPAANVPTALKVRNPKNIASERALKVLIKDMNKRLDPRFMDKLVVGWRNEFTRMVKDINSPELLQQVKGLSQKQFEFLWTNTNFASTVSLAYENSKAALRDKDDWVESRIESQILNAFTQIEDAKKIT